jgi:hypothetical protein
MDYFDKSHRVKILIKKIQKILPKDSVKERNI